MAKAKWPTCWMMTDERMGDALWPTLNRLPAGTGVVLRHYSHPDRAALAHDVAAIARRRALTLAVGSDATLARDVGAQLVHNPAGDAQAMPFSRAIHSPSDAIAANRDGASLAFVSPLFETRSHPGAATLSLLEARAIVACLDCPAIALGGMDADRFATVEDLGFAGWAGIDAWIRT